MTIGKSRGRSTKSSNTVSHRSINGLCLALRVQQHFWSIKARKQTNTFRLKGSLTSQILIKRLKWRLMLYRWKPWKVLLSFTDTIGHRSTGASSTWHGREREIGEKQKWPNLNVTNNLNLQRWHFIPLVIGKYITNYFKRNNFEVEAKRL